MTKAEKIKKIISLRMKIDEPIFIDTDKLNELYNKHDLIQAHQAALLTYCEQYKKHIYKYNDKQSNRIKDLDGDKLVNYCTHNNLSNHNDNTIINDIKFIKGEKLSLLNIHQTVHKIIVSILKLNKKYLNNNLKRLFDFKTFIDVDNENLPCIINKTLTEQWDKYIKSLEDKYNKMKEEEIDNIYNTYDFLDKLR